MKLMNSQFYFLFSIFVACCIFNIYSSLSLESKFTATETYQMREKICSKISVCKSCSDNNSNSKSNLIGNGDEDKLEQPFYFNVLSYGIPFTSSEEFKMRDCDCNKIIKVKKFCNDLENNDPLLGLTKYDLQGILLNIKQTDSDALDKNSKKIFRFKELGQIKVKKVNKNIPKFLHKKIKNKTDCNCMEKSARKSLFCQDKCKFYTDTKLKINSFYDEQMRETEELFENEIKKYR